MIVFIVLYVFGMSLNFVSNGYHIDKIDAISTILISGFIAVIHTINNQTKGEQ